MVTGLGPLVHLEEKDTALPSLFYAVQREVLDRVRSTSEVSSLLQTMAPAILDGDPQHLLPSGSWGSAEELLAEFRDLAEEAGTDVVILEAAAPILERVRFALERNRQPPQPTPFWHN